jgi:hypothetical protein
MAVTAQIGGEQNSANVSYIWSMQYDDVSRRVTAEATADPGIAAITVDVKLTASTSARVQFVRDGRDPDPDVDYPVVIGSGPTLVGPTIPPNQVARLIGKSGQTVGGLSFDESSSRV